MHDAPFGGNAHRTRSVDGTVDVLVANLAMPRLHRHDATAVLRRDVPSGNPDHRRVDGHPGHLLCHVHRLGHGLGGAVDLDHRSLADPP